MDAVTLAMACVAGGKLFFFQAEDGIRDLTVTGVQTCALPILWVQACGASGNRFVELSGRYNFTVASNVGANTADWALIYDAGGLVDIHQAEADARTAGDSTWLGIAKIWEALTVGSTADQWGNIPYSQIATSPTPAA